MEVTTLAGNPGKNGYKDGKGVEALFDDPAYLFEVFFVSPLLKVQSLQTLSETFMLLI